MFNTFVDADSIWKKFLFKSVYYILQTVVIIQEISNIVENNFP